MLKDKFKKLVKLKNKPAESIEQIDPVEEKTIQSLQPTLLYMRLNKVLLLTVMLSFVFLIVKIVEQISLHPLVEKRYTFMSVIGEQDNYVELLYTNYFENEGLIKKLIYRYVLKREAISPKDDVKYVMAYSKGVVKDEYIEIQKEIKERQVREYRLRTIIIDRYQDIEANIRQVEIITTDYIKDPSSKNDKTPTIEEQRWTINIKFEFIDEMRRTDQINKNPYGFYIVKYNLEKS